MGRANIVFGVVTLALAVLLAALLNQLHAERDLIDIQATRLEALKRDTAPAKSAQAPSAKPAPVQTAPSPGDLSAVVAYPVTVSPQMAQLKALRDPRYRAAEIAQRKIMVRAQLHDLHYWMRISGQGLDRLIGLLAEHAVEDMEMYLSAMDMQASGQPRLQQESLRQRQDSQLASLLGHPRFGEWKIYHAAADARRYLQEMNGHLPSGDFLAPEQVRLIATAMVQAERSMDEEFRRLAALAQPQSDPAARMALALRGAELSRQQDELMRAAAAPHLSAKQLAALDTAIQRKQEDARASLAVLQGQPAVRQ